MYSNKDRNKILKVRGLLLNGDENTEIMIKPEFKELKKSDLEEVVYSPNVFGWPSNDIEVMEKTSNSEVKQALERRNIPLPHSGGVDDDDVALDTIQMNGESAEDYYDRMQESINEAKEELSKSD